MYLKVKVVEIGWLDLVEKLFFFDCLLFLMNKFIFFIYKLIYKILGNVY